MPPAQQRSTSTTPSPNRGGPVEVVDPVWLLKAVGLSLAGALLCGYATLCFLFYQGSWQLILHPSHTIDATPATAGMAYSDVRFGASETGQPRLTAWWIPADSSDGFGAKYSSFTVLYLHDGSGSLSNSVPAVAALNRAGLNIFAIDYGGFGASDASAHPSEIRMTEDTAAALDYLTSTRHIPANHIIPYGVGLGASLAANLAHVHSDLPAVVLENPDPDPGLAATQGTRVIPARWLLGHPFDTATAISSLATPKLLIANAATDPQPAGHLQRVFKQAASPSFAVTLPPSGNDDANYQAALGRFLDQYLPQPGR